MSYDCMFTCRLSEDDREKLNTSAEHYGITPSRYLRYLIRLPNDFVNGNEDGPVLVFDTKSLARLARETIRWGHHYNQAVHALNMLAMLSRRNTEIDPEFFDKTLIEATEKLEAVEAGRRTLSAEVEELSQRVWVKGH